MIRCEREKKEQFKYGYQIRKIPLSPLNAREMEVLKLLLDKKINKNQISKRLNITRVTINKIIKKSMRIWPFLKKYIKKRRTHP